MADRIPQTLENCDLRICGEKDAPIAIDIDTPRFALIMAYSIGDVDVPKAKDNCRKAECFLTHNRRQSTANSATNSATNNVTNNATINANGTENGVNGVNVMTTKEQEQVKKLLDAIEKNTSAMQAYYAEQIGVSKRTVSRIFVSLQEKGILMQTGTKRKSNRVIKK